MSPLLGNPILHVSSHSAVPTLLTATHVTLLCSFTLQQLRANEQMMFHNCAAGDNDPEINGLNDLNCLILELR